MQLIDADAIVEKLKKQAHEIFTNAGKKVSPDDYYIKRNQTYMDTLMKSLIDNVIDFMGAQPTIEAEPVRRGHWEDLPCGLLECSECGELEWHVHNYCPECGAKMYEGGK